MRKSKKLPLAEGKLFDLGEPDKKDEDYGSKIKLKKGDTVDLLIKQAKKLVAEKLGKYKDMSRCVINLEDLQTFFDSTPDGAYVALDTETTGLDVFLDTLVGVCLCNGKQAIYVPLNHKNVFENRRWEDTVQMNPEAFKELFLKLISERKFQWIYHNAKFDLAVMRTFLGRPLPDPYWDTMIAGQLLNQDEEHSLKYLYNKYIAVEDEGVNKFDTLFKGVTFDYVDIDSATVYGAKDAFMTLELFEYQKKILDQPDFAGVKYVMENIEMPLLPILEDMQRTGVNLNSTMCSDLKVKYEIRLAEASDKVYSEIAKYQEEINDYIATHYKQKLDNPINLSSPTQLSILFYDIIGYKLKKGGRGTGIAELQEINTDLTNALIEYRKAEKLIDAFLVALPAQISKYDNKIHTSLNQYGAATGRFSSSNPNLQQIPSRGEGKELRRLFGASPRIYINEF